MSGNTFGKLFTLTGCGESHGPGLAAIVDGCPPGLALEQSELMADIERPVTPVSGGSPMRSRSSRGCSRA